MLKSSKSKVTELEMVIDPSEAAERVMLEWLLDEARRFYAIPENVKSFEAWKAERS